MPIQHVIAFTKNAAQYTHDAAVAGGQLNVSGAASAAVRAVEAAYAAYAHALADTDLVLAAPTLTLDKTAQDLSDLATEAARAARSVARYAVHGDWDVARRAVGQAREAANAALTAADAAETDFTDPGSILGHEAAQQMMNQAVVQADPDRIWAGEAVRRSFLYGEEGVDGGFDY